MYINYNAQCTKVRFVHTAQNEIPTGRSCFGHSGRRRKVAFRRLQPVQNHPEIWGSGAGATALGGTRLSERLQLFHVSCFIFLVLKTTQNQWFFSGVGAVNSSVDILVPPQTPEAFQTLLDHPDVEKVLLNPNIQKAIDNEGFRPESRANSFGWTSYYTLDEVCVLGDVRERSWLVQLMQIYAYLRTLAATYPSSVTLISGGSSFQGREILGVRLQTGSQPASQSVFIEANIHAREW